MEEDYEFGHLLRTDIIPNAVLWFTGEAVDDEDFDGDDEDDEDDEEGTALIFWQQLLLCNLFLYRDTDEDEEDEDEDKGGKKKGGALLKTSKGGFSAPKPAAPGAAGSAETPECKQN